MYSGIIGELLFKSGIVEEGPLRQPSIKSNKDTPADYQEAVKSNKLHSWLILN